MPLINSLGRTFSAGTVLTRRTLYQCLAGQVRVETGNSAPSEDDGCVLNLYDTIELEAGNTVYWKQHSTSTAKLNATELET